MSTNLTTRTQKSWQDELAEECRQRNLEAPVFNIVSDRRGGRTAWSATVTVNQQNMAARYWYDGQYLNNAKEDAAEVACTRLRSPALTSATQAGYQASTGFDGRNNTSSPGFPAARWPGQ